MPLSRVFDNFELPPVFRRKFSLRCYQINPQLPTAIIVHGLHKSGTMFLYQLFQRLARARGIAFYSPNNTPADDDLATQHLDHDFCVCPVRSFADPPILNSPRHRVKQIFHVRDPRDILVSQYFSYGWRHTEQGFTDGVQRYRDFVRENSIDDYVLNHKSVVEPLKRRLSQLISRNADDLNRVVRYEQMVLDFPTYLDQVIKVLEFRIPAIVRLRFAYRFRNEFKPDRTSNGHKRSVLPGDHTRKLQPKTIEALNEIFADELRALNYSTASVKSNKSATVLTNAAGPLRRRSQLSF